MATSLVQTERPLTLRKAPARFLNLPPATRQPAVSSPGRPIRPPRNLTPGQPCRKVFKVLVERGLLRLLAPRPPPNPLTKLSKYNPNAHCEFHQGPGHTTDRCFSLMHAVQDLIEQGKVVVYSSPSSSNTIFPNPLPPHSVSAPVGSSASVNLIEDAQRQEDLVYQISSASDEVNVISPLVLPVSTRPCLRGPIRVLSQLLHL